MVVGCVAEVSENLVPPSSESVGLRDQLYVYPEYILSPLILTRRWRLNVKAVIQRAHQT
jgi:hypothetical protein